MTDSAGSIEESNGGLPSAEENWDGRIAKSLRLPTDEWVSFCGGVLLASDSGGDKDAGAALSRRSDSSSA